MEMTMQTYKYRTGVAWMLCKQTRHSYEVSAITMDEQIAKAWVSEAPGNRTYTDVLVIEDTNVQVIDYAEGKRA